MKLGNISIFDDFRSYIHLIVGIISILTDDLGLILFIIFLFTAYEVWESKDRSETFSDLIEFYIGILIGYYLLVVG